MQVLNPYYVFVNSRDRISGTDENFLYNIKFPDNEFDRVVVLNALIPKSYYLIQNGPFENIFELQEDAATVTVTVPVGSYLLSTFKNTIGALLTTASPSGLTYTLTYPANNLPDTGKWTYTHNGAVQSSIIVNQHFFEPMGFIAGSTNAFTGATLESTCVIKLQSEDRLKISSNCCLNGRDDVLVSINSTSSINYSSINYICPAPEFYSRILSSKNNNTYSFTLTDEDGELIQLNGLNLNFTLLFYKKDPIFDQIRNFMKMIVMKK